MTMMLKYSHKTGCYDPDTFSVTHEKLYGETVNAINIIRKFEGVTNRETYVNTYCVNTLSPLCYDFAPLEKMFAYAEENQPLWIIPCAMPALTSPPSIFSTLAMTNAEILAGVVLSQLINPGLPVIYGNTSAATDLRSVLLSIGAPKKGRGRGGVRKKSLCRIKQKDFFTLNLFTQPPCSPILPPRQSQSGAQRRW